MCDLCGNAVAIREKAEALRMARDDDARAAQEEQKRLDDQAAAEQEKFAEFKRRAIEKATADREAYEAQKKGQHDAEAARDHAYLEQIRASQGQDAADAARKAMEEQRRKFNEDLQAQIDVKKRMRQAEKEADAKSPLTSVPMAQAVYDAAAVRERQAAYGSELERQIADAAEARRAARQADIEHAQAIAAGAAVPEAAREAAEALRKQKEGLLVENQRMIEEHADRARAERVASMDEGAQLAERLRSEDEQLRKHFQELKVVQERAMQDALNQQIALRQMQLQREKDYDSQFAAAPPEAVAPDLYECRCCHRDLPASRFSNYDLTDRQRPRRKPGHEKPKKHHHAHAGDGGHAHKHQ